MNTPWRAAVGFVFGLILGALAFLLSGAGHGTYAPMVANVSVLAFIPVLGVVVAVFGAPFLWSLYFIVIPTIDSHVRRSIALGVISLLHLVPGMWLVFQDSAFTRAVQSDGGIVLAYGVGLTATILCLAFFSSVRRSQANG